MVDSEKNETASPHSGADATKPQPPEDFNSTVMAIDISKLNLDRTNTQINAPLLSSDEEILEEKLEQKKSFFRQFWDRIVRPRVSRSRATTRPLPKMLERFVTVWVCRPGAGVLNQLLFYVSRLLFVILSVYGNLLLIQALGAAYQAQHPARYFFVGVVTTELLLLLAVLLLRFSAFWVVALPGAALSLIMACGAYFFHTADRLYFLVQEEPASALLSAYYTTTSLLVLVCGVLFAVRGKILKLLVLILGLLFFLPCAYGYFLKIPFETTFFGAGFFAKIPYFYAQPIYLALHVGVPALFFIFLFTSFGGGRDDAKVMARGFSRSLCFLLLAVFVLNVSLLQRNRVPHVFNFLMPRKLNVGGAETMVLNQWLKIETKNFADNEGADEVARYRFTLKPAKEQGMYQLDVVDEFSFPVKYLSAEDIVVTSDGHAIKMFQFQEENGADAKAGHYLVKLALTPKQELITWETKKDYFNTDKIIFTLTDLARVKRFVVKAQEENLLDVVPSADGRVELPLYYFDAGDHEISVSLFDDLAQEIFTKSVPIVVKIKSDFDILSPLDGDVVGDQVSVLVFPKNLDNDAVSSLTYQLGDVVVAQADGAQFRQSLDLVSQGADVVITVKMVTKLGEITKNVKVKHVALAPSLEIVKPTLGTFSLRTSTVEYTLKGSDKSIAGLHVLVNGLVFGDYKIQKDGFELPVARWQMPEIFLSVQATLDDGQRVSDWVQVNRGLGVLDLVFDTKSLGFVNFKKFAVILDASVSTGDNWHGQTKWDALRDVVLAPEIENKIKNFNPMFIVYGAKNPYYFKDCHDVSVVSNAGQYNKSLLKRKLTEIKPTGISSLSQSLKEAYKSEPDKVFIFADSTDSCSEDLVKTLDAAIQQSPLTQVNVFVLGQVLDHDKKELQKISQKTGGRFYQPDNTGALLKSWSDEMSLAYELTYNGKQIDYAELANKKFHLLPGTYTLKIPYGNQIKSHDFTLENGTKMILSVSGQGGKIHIEEKVMRL